MAWNVVGDSVAGSGHLVVGLPCQDSLRYSCLAVEGDEVLIAALADGAGSAARSDEGADLVTRALVRGALELLGAYPHVSHDAIGGLFAHVLEEVHQFAGEQGCLEADLACTALLVISGPRQTIAAQVGDGAIVWSTGAAPVRAVLASRSQYINETTFITSGDLLDHLEITSCDAVQWVAMMSDGVEGFAIRYADDVVSPGFFTAPIEALRVCDDPTEMQADLRGFLRSDRVMERTDDDRTLLLAAIRAPADAP